MLHVKVFSAQMLARMKISCAKQVVPVGKAPNFFRDPKVSSAPQKPTVSDSEQHGGELSRALDARPNTFTPYCTLQHPTHSNVAATAMLPMTARLVLHDSSRTPYPHHWRE